MTKRFPVEFSDLLTRTASRQLERGALRAVLGRDGRRFVAFERWMRPAAARAGLELLEATFPDRLLQRMDAPIPPEAIWGMRHNYSELLPKSVRVSTAMLENRRARAFQRAEEIGLVTMLRSESFRAFAEQLNGRALRPRWGIQLLCYGEGDYTGPHNDHHPEDAEAQDGYVDVHLTFANEAVARQLLVYERRGHLCEVHDAATLGGITAYRLPFWHYTTPLEARARAKGSARRWVLLGTFLDAQVRSTRPRE